MIEIGRSRLTLSDIRAVSRRAASVSLSDPGLDLASRSAAWGDRVAARRPLYGRSTGVGANRIDRVDDPVGNVLGLLASHATAAGELRSAGRVRAMLVIRLNQLAAGGSGVSPAVLHGLVEMLGQDALPAIREWGSIGTGDLSALATTALALAGRSPTAPGRCPPILLAAGDGLGLLSSNAATLADAALATADLAGLARSAVVVAALTGAAVGVNTEAYSSVIERATPYPGPIAVAGWLRTLLAGGGRGLRPAARIQDPFALRALPQVHGPVLDAVRTATELVESAVAAPAENPLLLPGTEPEAMHHGAFFATSLQLALDQLNLAVAGSAPGVLGRLALLMEPGYTGLPPFLADRAGVGSSGAMVVEYVAASVVGSLRAAAQPAGLQTAHLSRGMEDDASFASQAARQSLVVVDRYRTLVATELVAAVRALRLQQQVLPTALQPAWEHSAALSTEMTDRDLTPDLALAAGLLDGLAEMLV